MSDTKDGSLEGSSGDRKLSIPNSVQRRKFGSFGTYNRVVVCAVDPSCHAKAAFLWFLKHVWRPDDLVVIVYCPEPPHIPSLSFRSGFSLPTEKWKEIMTDMNSKIQALEIDYESICLEKKLHFKMRGDSTHKNAGEGICHIAEVEKADLIVMGTRGMGAVKRTIIGSVSEYVIRHASIPSLVVPKETLPL